MGLTRLAVIAGIACGIALAAGPPPMCPAPAKAIQASCREITYKDLPEGAKTLLRKLKCDVGAGSNYDYGSAVDLNGDGSPEYQFCCHEAPHGPCDARLIGKVANEWKDLTGSGGLSGYDDACGRFVILETQHNGFHDVCLADQCSAPTTPAACAPAIWQFQASRYRTVNATPAKPSK